MQHVSFSILSLRCAALLARVQPGEGDGVRVGFGRRCGREKGIERGTGRAGNDEDEAREERRRPRNRQGSVGVGGWAVKGRRDAVRRKDGREAGMGGE